MKTKLGKQVAISGDVNCDCSMCSLQQKSDIFIVPLQNIAMTVAAELGICV